MGNWLYQIEGRDGMVINEVRDDCGNTIFDENGNPKTVKFKVHRTYLHIFSEKYAQTLVFHVNAPSKRTDRGTQLWKFNQQTDKTNLLNSCKEDKQKFGYFEMQFRKFLDGKFTAAEIDTIIKECKEDKLGG